MIAIGAGHRDHNELTKKIVRAYREHYYDALSDQQILQIEHQFKLLRDEGRIPQDLYKEVLREFSKYYKKGSATSRRKSPAMLNPTENNTKGGIDLNPAQMSMQIKKNGEDFKFEFNGTPIDAAQVTGVSFTICSMTSVTNLPKIIGLNMKLSENKIFSIAPS